VSVVATRRITTTVLRGPEAAGGRRAVPSRFVGVGVVVMLLLGAAGFALGRASQESKVSSGPSDAWLATSGHGSVSLVNGVTGQSGLELVIPGAKGHSLTVDQQGTTVLVDDSTSGEIIRIDVNQLTLGPAVEVGQGTSVFTAASATYLVDYSTGTVTRVDPVTLRATSAAFHIAGTLGRQAAVAADGTLWIPVLSNGTVVPVTASGAGAAVQISRGGSVNLAMTSIGGRAVAVDQSTDSITVVGGGGTKVIGLPATTSPARLLAPASAGASAYLPILAATKTPSLVLANVSDGSTRAVPIGAVGSDQLGSPVIADDRVYIPDYTQGSALVYDISLGRWQPDVAVTGSAGNFDAQVVNGTVFFNDPNTSYAVTVDPSGAVHRVAKTGPGVPTSTGQPSAPTPPPPVKQSPPPNPARSTPAVIAAPVVTPPTHTAKSGPPTSPAVRAGTTPPAPPAPLAPVGVTATSGSGYVDVSWRAPASGGQIASYRVLVSPAGGTQTALSATSVRVSGLICSTSYGFTVASVGTNGETVPAVAAFAHPCLPPAAPTGFMYWDQPGTPDAMYLTWNTVSSSDGPVSYLISWSGGSQTATTGTTVVSGLLPGRVYAFTVRAVDPAGTGPAANYPSQTAGLDASQPVQLTGWYTVYTEPTYNSATAWNAPENWKYTTFCQYSGGQDVTADGYSSSIWVYMVNNGVFGWANSLWISGGEGVPDCTSPLVP
jgi:fibronectin type III domain protein